jgi:GNAT superfamily N-acetyltransferase
MTFTARKAQEADLPALAALFDASSCGCHCRYWFFDGTKNDWLARTAFEPEKNKMELGLELGTEPLVGVVATVTISTRQRISAPQIVGWMRLTERARVPRLPRLPVYKMLELGDDAGIASISCFLVHPEYRGQGVAHALLAAAIQLVGATHHMEAYPRRAMDAQRLSDEEAWLGPIHLLESQGFQAHAVEPKAGGPFSASTPTYPIYRRPRSGG